MLLLLSEVFLTCRRLSRKNLNLWLNYLLIRPFTLAQSTLLLVSETGCLLRIVNHVRVGSHVDLLRLMRLLVRIIDVERAFILLLCVLLTGMTAR